MGGRTTEVRWTDDDKPADWKQWESIISEELEDTMGVCEVELTGVSLKVEKGEPIKAWQIAVATCGGVSVGTGPTIPPIGPDLDVRPHVLTALAKARKPVVGALLSYEHCPKCKQRLAMDADGYGAPIMTCHGSCDYTARLYSIPDSQ